MGIPDSIIREVRIYCKEHGVKNLFLFGSYARSDATQSSDIDLLIEFQTDMQISYLDLLIIKSDLERIMGAKVDLIEKDTLVNPIRRKGILAEKILLYAS
ncbi:MAG: nucleotidyltransferase domain-containing protein [Candidatus Aegiribacteria sp.]|nr:nucleotidyltransferase domain-containing protein [Candidatus Aegiribacteria sp.]